ncbi:hypothetical protein BOTBODRAFT_29305 [Botryobasidium botryosum FD-172 SS1]|uniref:Uncharacterized protein n=1 Tax=Botryobasidium botryosum (strain FD-172 SS1) TaxID=930990 RepID=A0A067N1G6_BOTB1|nr:hypothetical protein BOTBODRAFT_29305 [Botryobasidium botryosum FD-172 SS1]
MPYGFKDSAPLPQNISSGTWRRTLEGVCLISGRHLVSPSVTCSAFWTLDSNLVRV